MACPSCFHASVTRQRSTGSETRFSCSHVHEKTHPCKQGFENKSTTQPDAENLLKADENNKLEQRNWKTLNLLSFVSTGCSKTVETLHKLEECTSSRQQSRTLRYKNTCKNTCNTGVCPRTHPQDYKVRIKGNRTVAPLLQTKVLRTTDVLQTKKRRK